MSGSVQSRSADWITGIGEPVAAISGSPDSTNWAVMGTEGNIALVDATGGLHSRWQGHQGGGFRLAWHPTLELLATSGGDRQVKFWNPKTGELIHACDGGSAWVELLEWSPDGKLLASGAGRSLTLWTPEGQSHRVWKDHRSTLAALGWRADSKKVAAACYGGVQIYDPSSAKAEELLPWKTSLLSLAWSPDHRWVVAGTQDLSVQIWPQPFRTGDELAMSGYSAKVRDLAWHYSGRYLATGGGEEIMVWDCGGKGPAGTTPRILTGHTGRISSLKYQARGHFLASGAIDGSLCIWNAKLPNPLRALQLSAEITSLAWSRNDQCLLAGTRDGSVALVKAPAA